MRYIIYMFFFLPKNSVFRHSGTPAAHTKKSKKGVEKGGLVV